MSGLETTTPIVGEEEEEKVEGQWIEQIAGLLFSLSARRPGARRSRQG